MAIIDGNISGVTPTGKAGSDIYNQDKGDLQKLRDSILDSFKTQQTTLLEISKNVKIVSDYITLHPEFIDYVKLSTSIKDAISEVDTKNNINNSFNTHDYSDILNKIYSSLSGETITSTNETPIKSSSNTTESIGENKEDEKTNPFEKMLNSIKGFFSPKSSEKIQPKSPIKPKPDDILSAKDLPSLVASGFLLLHNDLDSGSSGSLASKALGIGGMGLATGVGSMLGAGLAGMVGGMFAGLSPMSAIHLKEIVEELNESITYDDIKDNADIKQAQIEGISSYIKAYFIGQSASSIINEVIGSIGPAIVDGVKNTISSLFEGTRPETKIQTILNDLLDSMSSEDYLNDPDILKAEKTGVMMYLMTYFTSQCTSLVMNTAVTSSMDAIVDGAKRLLGGLFGKDRQTSKIETILNTLIDSISTEEYLNDPDIHQSMFDGMNSYIKSYFISQTAGQVLDATIGSLGEVIGNFAKGVFTGLFGKSNKEEEKLNAIIHTVIEAIDVNEFTKDPSIHQSLFDGMASYIKQYFKAQAAAALTSTTEGMTKDVVGGFGKGFLKGVASWFGIDGEESPLEQKINNILSLVVSNISVSEMANSDSTQKAVEEGVSNVVSSFFNSQFASVRLDNAASNTFSKAFISKAKSIMTSADLFNDIKVADFKPTVKNSIRSVMNSMMTSMTDDFIRNSKEKLKLSDSDYSMLKESFLNTVKSSVTDSIENNNTIISGNIQSEDRIIEVVDKMNVIIEHLTNIENKESESINIINTENSNFNTEF